MEPAADMRAASDAPGSAPSVLVLAQLPPPVHGVTITTERVVAAFASLPGARIDQVWGGSATSLIDIDSRSVGKLAHFAHMNLRLAARLLAGRRYDVVYTTLAPLTHAAIRDGIVAWWAKRLGQRALVHLHGEGIEATIAGGDVSRRIVRALLHKTELVAVTARAAEAASASGLFAAVHRLPNTAPDPGEPSFDAARPIRLGFLGNLDPRKGVLRFVDTVAHLVASGWNVEAAIAGSSTTYLGIDELAARIAGLGLSRHIALHGPVHGEAKDRFLADLDVFIYLSLHDHAPLVLIEALSHGLVPVVLDTGGVAEIVGPELAQHVLPSDLPDDARSLRIASLLAPYRADRQRLVEDRQRARARYL
ncbi:MAG: glycosyltransferase family 4 protein, partial [Hyphomicrobiaceae bacterium]